MAFTIELAVTLGICSPWWHWTVVPHRLYILALTLYHRIGFHMLVVPNTYSVKLFSRSHQFFNFFIAPPPDIWPAQLQFDGQIENLPKNGLFFSKTPKKILSRHLGGGQPQDNGRATCTRLTHPIFTHNRP